MTYGILICDNRYRILYSKQCVERQEEQLAPSIKFIRLTDLTISYLKVATGWSCLLGPQT